MNPNPKLVVVVNGQAVIEYDRNKRLPGHQRQFLDKMDHDMDQGIELGGKKIDKPDLQDKAKYVAVHLINAVVNEQDSMIAAMCAYLATRLPDLKQVKAFEVKDEFSFDLVFDKEHTNTVNVQFDSSLSKTH